MNRPVKFVLRELFCLTPSHFNVRFTPRQEPCREKRQNRSRHAFAFMNVNEQRTGPPVEANGANLLPTVVVGKPEGHSLRVTVGVPRPLHQIVVGLEIPLRWFTTQYLAVMTPAPKPDHLPADKIEQIQGFLLLARQQDDTGSLTKRRELRNRRESVIAAQTGDFPSVTRSLIAAPVGWLRLRTGS